MNPVTAKQLSCLTSYNFHDIKLGNLIIMNLASFCLCFRNVLLLGRILTTSRKYSIRWIEGWTTRLCMT
jgi:hypothetical protein